MATYEIRLADRDGSNRHTLSTATFSDSDTIREELNGWGGASFTLPTEDTSAADHAAVRAAPLKREVQILRNGEIRFIGPVVRLRQTRDACNVQCHGLLWYFTRRNFGPILTDYLVNGSFETELSPWTAVGPSASISTSQRARGDKAVRLQTASAGSDHYLQQAIQIAVGPLATLFFLAGWYQIDPNQPWVGAARQQRGLYLGRISGASTVDFRFAEITNGDNSNHRGEWQRLETAISLPANTTSTADVRLYCPGGAVYWDALTLTTLESLMGGPGETFDAYAYIAKIVEQAQSLARGKGSLNISTAGPLTGYTLERHYQFADVQNCWEAMAEYPEQGICDLGTTWNGTGTERNVQVYSPKKGTYKPNLGVGFHNIAEWSYDIDGEQTANYARVLGQGEGSDREVGLYADTTQLGTAYEVVESAPSDAPISSLDKRARRLWDKRKDAVKVPTVTVESEAHVENLRVGDTIPVQMSRGVMSENTTRRVVSLALKPRDETLAIGWKSDD